MRTILFVVCLVASVAFAQPSDALLDAIEQVESSGRGVNTPDGDGGKAIGPFQIWKSYWKDAVEYDKSLASGSYQDCRKPEYARRVVRAYLTRYGRGKTNEEMARIHNGGPRGHKKHSTLEYWERVKREIK